MKLEQQVTSLELSKKLKELGVKQEGFIVWESYYLPITTDCHNNLVFSKDIGAKKRVERSGFKVSKYKQYSAFTVAELGEILEKVDLETMNKLPVKFQALNERDAKESIFRADFWAEIIIYLIENKLIKTTCLKN